MLQKVSIIIPNYNGAKYLADCINSVRAQTYPNIEIIVIDDRSKDDSFKIASKIAARDRRVIVKQMPRNGSVGAARNYGVDISKGDLIMFLDSDDAMPPNAVEIMTSLQNMVDADIVVAKYAAVPETFCLANCWLFPPPVFEFAFYDDVFEYQQSTDPIRFVVCWGKLIKRGALSGVRFLEKVHPHEDTDFMLRLYAGTKAIVTMPNVAVYYRQSPTSVMGRKKHDHSDSVIKMLQSLAAFTKSKAAPENYMRFIRQYVYWFLWHYATALACKNAKMTARLPGVARTAWRLGLLSGARMPWRNRMRLKLLSYGIGLRGIGNV